MWFDFLKNLQKTLTFFCTKFIISKESNHGGLFKDENMSKYMILLIFLFISSSIVKTPAESKTPRHRLESFKTHDKGPVLHPLREKPNKRSLLLADRNER